MKDHAQLLRAIAAQASKARLSTGARVLDAGDVRDWLIELAEKAETPKPHFRPSPAWYTFRTDSWGQIPDSPFDDVTFPTIHRS